MLMPALLKLLSTSIHFQIGYRAMEYPKTSREAVAARIRLLIDVFSDGDIKKFCQKISVDYDRFRKAVQSSKTTLQIRDAMRIWDEFGADINWLFSGYGSIPPILQEAINQGKLTKLYQEAAQGRGLPGWPWEGHP